VIMMESYIPHDVTKEAKEIAQTIKTELANEGGEHFGEVTERVPLLAGLQRGVANAKIKVNGKHQILIGHDLTIELSAVEQIVEKSQTNVIADTLLYLAQQQQQQQQSGSSSTPLINGKHTLKEVMERLKDSFDEEGLDVINAHKHIGHYARPRVFEIAAAMNRLRTMAVHQKYKQEQQQQTPSTSTSTSTSAPTSTSSVSSSSSSCLCNNIHCSVDLCKH